MLRSIYGEAAATATNLKVTATGGGGDDDDAMETFKMWQTAREHSLFVNRLNQKMYPIEGNEINFSLPFEHSLI